jgi:SAM-dependent methyltransferase
MTATLEIDHAKVEEQTLKLMGYFGGAVTSVMIWLGDELGLYRAMAGAGPLTSERLAEKTALSERWLREWLSQQAAAGVLGYRDGAFELSPETALLLADESTPASAIGFLASLPDMLEVSRSLPECFKTGRGRKYDEHGAAIAAGMQRGTAPLTSLFVEMAIPALAGMPERLEAGAKVADIGCGAGGRLIALALRYPASRFHGYDISEHALELARANAAAAGASNVGFHNPETDPIPADASFDLVTFGDVVHDLALPDLVLRGARQALKPDGTMLVIDVAAGETLEENLQNPMAPLFFGVSQLICMSSSLSEEGGAGLGTLGLSPSRLRALCEGAGFTRFRTSDVADPMNAYYEIKP